MNSFNRALNLAGWITFSIAFIVFIFSVERTGSLWDCGEFILGAYKLQVVHPPGAPLFLIIGRMFAMLGDAFSSDPSTIAFAVNLMSGMVTAFAGMFVCWSTMYLGKISLVGRDAITSAGQNINLLLAGLAAGLSATFCVSVWFSAVEGEVYAMSTFFTALTLWSMLKWYYLPDNPSNDRWLVFTVFMAGLSIGVHLLSLLTFPALAIFYYLKKYPKTSIMGFGMAILSGLFALFIMQKVIIVGIPSLLLSLDKFMVNSLGLPFYTGLIPFVAIIGGLLYWGFNYAHKNNNHNAQLIVTSLLLVVSAYSTTAVSVLRAKANPPINMNNPSDPAKLLPYLNREQYGDRPLLFGPNFNAKPIGVDAKPRYGKVGKRYEVVDQKYEYKYNANEYTFFPRMGHGEDESKVRLYQQWMGHQGNPTMGDNLSFFMRYQVGWMYWRYFMWNFVGKQNGEQGYMPWDKTKGHWYSGVSFIDNARLGDQSQAPLAVKNDPARNAYYFIPLLLGLIGLFWHYKRAKNDWIGLLMLFLITGIGIIVYSNQPPIEPRERDYVLVGSFFTFCIWIGMGGLAIGQFIGNRMKGSQQVGYIVGGLLALTSPILMVSQNMDDMGRKGIYAARDYASNFLNSLAPNAIIFTYGDNDTYPLWYAQEVENIRKDVRVVNLSLIAVDWYIDQQRRKINDSEAIKFTIPSESYAGNKRNQVYFINSNLATQELPATSVLKFIGEHHPLEGSSTRQESFIPTNKVYIQVDKAQMLANKLISPADSTLDIIPVNLGVKEQGDYITKDVLAVFDIIASNINERPIYFSVTANPSKFLGLNDYLQLEGLGLRVVPIRTPSDRQFGIFGMGRVQHDSLYNNVMTKFKWGNFDKEKLYVDKSYLPSVNAMRMVQMRAAYDMMAKGDKERAVALGENILKVFPDMNFRYDGTIIPIIALMVQSDQLEKAKPYIKTLANNMRENMIYYQSMDPYIREMGHAADFEETKRTINDINDILKNKEDKAFIDEINKILGPYIPKGNETENNLLN